MSKYHVSLNLLVPADSPLTAVAWLAGFDKIAPGAELQHLSVSPYGGPFAPIQETIGKGEACGGCTKPKDAPEAPDASAGGVGEPVAPPAEAPKRRGRPPKAAQERAGETPPADADPEYQPPEGTMLLQPLTGRYGYDAEKRVHVAGAAMYWHQPENRVVYATMPGEPLIILARSTEITEDDYKRRQSEYAKPAAPAQPVAESKEITDEAIREAVAAAVNAKKRDAAIKVIKDMGLATATGCPADRRQELMDKLAALVAPADALS